MWDQWQHLHYRAKLTARCIKTQRHSRDWEPRPLQIPLLNLTCSFPELQTLDTGCVAAQLLLVLPNQYVEHLVVCVCHWSSKMSFWVELFSSAQRQLYRAHTYVWLVGPTITQHHVCQTWYEFGNYHLWPGNCSTWLINWRYSRCGWIQTWLNTD